jgi:predicted HicB family RNase H-like nuclease
MVHAAEAKGLTLNQWIIEAVRHQLGAEGGEPVLVRAA